MGDITQEDDTYRKTNTDNQSVQMTRACERQM